MSEELPIDQAEREGDLSPPETFVLDVPTFDDPAVIEAIERDRASYEERARASLLTADEVYGSPADPATPLVEFPDDSKIKVLGLVELNVMHNGAPALRKFHASTAYSPPA